MVSVNYKPMRDMLAYAKYSTGFVSGGAVGPVPFEPETVESWELGFKADLLDRRLRTNLALFDAKYQNIQSAQGGINVGHPELGTVVLDQGGSKAKGFELEATLLPLRGVTLNAGLGYTDVHFTSVNPILGTLDTFKPTLVPKWTSNLSANYETQPLFGEARVVASINADWRSKERTYTLAPDPAYDAILFSPASWVVNTRVALQHVQLKKGDLEFAIWTKNLFDNKAVQFPLAFGSPGTVPFVASTTYQAARTFGLDVIYNY
jgi:iron complex outermembrane receptor protein